MAEVRCAECEARVERLMVRPSLFGGNDVTCQPCGHLRGVIFDHRESGEP